MGRNKSLFDIYCPNAWTASYLKSWLQIRTVCTSIHIGISVVELRVRIGQP